MSSKVFEPTGHRVQHAVLPEAPAVDQDGPPESPDVRLYEQLCLLCGWRRRRSWLGPCGRCGAQVIVESVSRAKAPRNETEGTVTRHPPLCHDSSEQERHAAVV
jgi:hypothetical protein